MESTTTTTAAALIRSIAQTSPTDEAAMACDLADIAQRQAIGQPAWGDADHAARISDVCGGYADTTTPEGCLALGFSLLLAAGAQPTEDQMAAAEALGLWGDE